MSLNKQLLIGHLGRDPELKITPSGTKLVSLSIATNESWKNDKGEKQTDTQWHNLVFWGQKAEVIQQYGKKGMHIYVEGKTEHQKYTDKNGVEKTTTKVRVDNFSFLGKSEGGRATDESNVPPSAKKARPGDYEPDASAAPNDDDDDEIPF